MKNKTESCRPAEKDLFTGSIKAITVLILILFFGFCESVFAQDLLILKSGKELKVNIIEENADIIKYREYESPSGPVYSIGRDKVESVKYKKGTRETQAAVVAVPVKPASDFPAQSSKSNVLTTKKRYIYLDGVPQTPRSIRLLMEDQPEALRSYESGRKSFAAARICPWVAMAITFPASFAVNNMEEQSDKTRVGLIVLSIDGAIIITAILLGSAGRKNYKNSISLYNSAANKPVSYRLDFGLQDNGIGIALRF
jgi:hypothetical protein